MTQEREKELRHENTVNSVRQAREEIETLEKCIDEQRTIRVEEIAQKERSVKEMKAEIATLKYELGVTQELKANEGKAAAQTNARLKVRPPVDESGSYSLVAHLRPEATMGAAPERS